MTDETKPKKSLRDMGPGPILGVSHGPQRREITQTDFVLSKIPLELSKVEVDKIGDPKVKEVIRRYKDKIIQMLDTPVGLLITGSEGVGKSAIAAIAGIEARHWYRSVLRLSHTDLQELQVDRDRILHADGQLTRDAIKSVDLLILDNFNTDFVIDNTFGPIKLEKLIQSRVDLKKATILTTRISFDIWKNDHSLKSLYSVMQGAMVGVLVQGESWHQKKQKELKALI